jgi:hypothetical protein
MVQSSLPFARRRLAFSRVARRFAGQAVHFVDREGQLLVVTRCCTNRSEWRLTWFDREQQPVGHSERPTHREAVLLAADYGAKPDTCALIGGVR